MEKRSSSSAYEMTPELKETEEEILKDYDIRNM